ncbi:hypothetical protein LXM94_09130 [Rhizobium sp. TRM95111]|uniref:hypothetical protein n=1 Tax=Rhizobium alarense TaxID=2846851 RepID=UPI001F3C196C|nr:hypothetical protein [Rhizobium alarense]MCF3640130.1 hypothetical protein [Rhizobium alarense]
MSSEEKVLSWQVPLQRVMVFQSVRDDEKQVADLKALLGKHEDDLQIVFVPPLDSAESWPGTTSTWQRILRVRDRILNRTTRVKKIVGLGVGHAAAYAILLDLIVDFNAAYAIAPRFRAQDGSSLLPFDLGVAGALPGVRRRAGRLAIDDFTGGPALSHLAALMPLARCVNVKGLKTEAGNHAFESLLRSVLAGLNSNAEDLAPGAIEIGGSSCVTQEDLEQARASVDQLRMLLAI